MYWKLVKPDVRSTFRHGREAEGCPASCGSRPPNHSSTWHPSRPRGLYPSLRTLEKARIKSALLAQGQSCKGVSGIMGVSGP
jgi:hypothetical protein